MRIVLDTNVLLTSISDRSSLHDLFVAFLDERYEICVTTEILTEYEEIISRHMGSVVASYIMGVIDNASNVNLITRYYAWRLIEADPDDNKFVDCAIAANASYIVSDDKHFNVLKQIPFPEVRVLKAIEFQDVLRTPSDIL